MSPKITASSIQKQRDWRREQLLAVALELALESPADAEISILNRSSSKMRSLKQLAKELDLLHLLDKSVLELSGGERQRVSIAIALSRESPLCLMDEPLSAQDEEHQVMIGQYLAKLSASGFFFLIATHDTSPFDLSAKAVISL